MTEDLGESWRRDGYVVLEQAVPHELIDRLNAEVASFRATSGEKKDEFGYGQRIGVFHAKSATALAVARNERVRDFLKWAFEDDPLLFGSLTFEAGSEQAAHVDSIFFFTQPVHAMAGCWTALEDVHPDAGPLFYYPGSHRWPLDRAETVLREHPDLARELSRLRKARAKQEERAPLAGALGNKWTERLLARIAASKVERTPALVKKGDVVIWHALLVHGGSPRKDRSLSRRSLVTHFVGKKAPMFDMTAFFTLPDAEFTKKNAYPMDIVEDPRGAYVRHARVVTY